MRTSTRYVLTLAAISALGMTVVGTAAAQRIEIRGAERGFRIASLFHVVIGFGSEPVAVECPVTLEGSFHSRTLTKVVRGLVGYFSRTAVNEAGCRATIGPEQEVELPGVKLRFLTETLPWHLQYTFFTGVLPRIASVGVQLVGLALEVYELPIGTRCLYRASVEVPMRYRFVLGEGGRVLRLESEAGAPLVPFVRGGLLCATEGMAYTGAHAVTQLGSTSALSVTLI